MRRVVVKWTHGALGERALEQVLPSLEDFPYADIRHSAAKSLESNGSSSSITSICDLPGTTLCVSEEPDGGGVCQLNFR